MAITVELPNGDRVIVQRDSATIGSGLGADVIVESSRLEPVHAKISRVAGRWMVESTGDWLLQVDDGVLGRKHWLQAGQVIHLTEFGVEVIFEPALQTPSIHRPKVVGVSAPSSKDEDASPKVAVPPPLPSEPSSPPSIFPELAGLSPTSDFLHVNPQSQAPPPLPATDSPLQSRKPSCPTIGFRGKGMVMIGKGTITFSGVRSTKSGQPKTGSLIVPLSDVDDVQGKEKRICVSFKLNGGVTSLAFDAASTKDATLIESALFPDELSELQRKRTEASGHPIAIDPSPARVFSVVYELDVSGE